MASLNPFVHPKDLRRRAQGEVLVHRIRRRPLQEEPWHPVHRAFCPSLRMDLRRRPHTAQGPFSHHASTTIKGYVKTSFSSRELVQAINTCDYDMSTSGHYSKRSKHLLDLISVRFGLCIVPDFVIRIWYIIITDEEEKGFIVSGKIFVFLPSYFVSQMFLFKTWMGNLLQVLKGCSEHILLKANIVMHV
ncbi:hypothetical protein TRIUR3_15427 [Triticum urartu]|uniref:Uncharacterized protein n=1 Tax=Triticum urartu TaxID=4572 RepID=M8A073_TRIUA|nr:hypothetical protein TRIUR3_15427 [Triticum urartu]